MHVENGRNAEATDCTLTLDLVACSALKLRVCIVMCLLVVLRIEDETALVAALRVGDCMVENCFKLLQVSLENVLESWRLYGCYRSFIEPSSAVTRSAADRVSTASRDGIALTLNHTKWSLQYRVTVTEEKKVKRQVIGV